MKEYNGIINVSEPENDYSIYLIYSSDITDDSVYIGITNNYKQRCYKHSIDRKRKEHQNKPLYKWLNENIDIKDKKVIFRVLEEKLTEKNVFQKEQCFIKFFRKNNCNVLNISNGGKGNFGNIPWNKGIKIPDHIVQKYKDSHKGQVSPMKGRTHKESSKKLIKIANKKRKESGWINPKKKQVFKYDKNHNLIKTYSSLKEASDSENTTPTSIGEWCRKEKLPKNNDYIWSYTILNK